MSRPHSTEPDASPKEPKRFLIGTYSETRSACGYCPNAMTHVRRERRGGPWEIRALRCNQWQCPYCGQRRAFQLAIRCEQAEPTKFITLTIQPKFFQTPREAYDQTRRKVSDFAKVLRLGGRTFEYLKVLEATKKGWPHYHLIARTPYVPQKLLSVEWAKLTGAPIVDVRAVKKKEGVFKYVLKYLCKQAYIPWTNRRVSWSRDFFPTKEPTEPIDLSGFNSRVEYQHPSTYLANHFNGRQATEIRPGLWAIPAGND